MVPQFPTEHVPEMAEFGLLGAPHGECDLPGLNSIACGLINQELEAGDSGLRSFVSVQPSPVMFPILQ